MSGALLEVRALKKSFNGIEVLHSVDFEAQAGKVTALVGENGAGKSTLMKILMGEYTADSGEIRLEGKQVQFTSPHQALTSGISMIFQEPMTALDPMYTIEEQICESLLFHASLSKAEMHDAALEMLRKVKIPRPEQILKDYPHHLSGGMLQRVMIAIALINNPRLLIADEPTTALDVTIQAQILDLMNELRESYDTSVIMITHDLGVIAETCEEVAVFYAGQVVEQSDVNTIFHAPAHPYTAGLLRSVLSLGGAQQELYTIQGTVPTAGNFSAGCRFADRCEHCMDICRNRAPALSEISPGHLCRCWLHADTPKEETA